MIKVEVMQRDHRRDAHAPARAGANRVMNELVVRLFRSPRQHDLFPQLRLLARPGGEGNFDQLRTRYLRPFLHARERGIGKDDDLKVARLANDRVKKAVGYNLRSGGLQRAGKSSVQGDFKRFQPRLRARGFDPSW